MKILNKYKVGIPKGSVFIGRPAPFGNPKVIGKDGTREEVIAWYRGYLRDKILERDPVIIDALRELTEDTDLVCFCDPKPCHGEVIREYWQEIRTYDSFDEGINAFIQKYHQYPIRAVIHPKNDCIDHLNIYTKAATRLGRLLSNMAHTPFRIEPYGDFQSVEGFWYWLASGKQHDRLKEMFGFDAKKYGRLLGQVPCDDFAIEIKRAIKEKINQNSEIQGLLKISSLPFTHYYYYGDIENPKIILRPQDTWLVDFIEGIRLKYLPGGKKVIIAGSRSITDYKAIREAYLNYEIRISEVVSGCAAGVDTLGEQLAEEFGIPVKKFPADWDKHGKSAGILRNIEMADYADELLSVWDGVSMGTKHMQQAMYQRNKKVYNQLYQGKGS